MNILAIDVGTSTIKAALLDQASAEPIGPIARQGYRLASPQPEAAEVAADELLAAIGRAVRQALADGRQPVAGIGLSCLTPCLCLLDVHDRPLAPFRIHADRRSRPMARRVQAEMGEEFLAIVGNRPLPGGISVLSFAQLMEEQPQLRRQVRRYLHANGWLGLHLTGETAFDPANACFSGLCATFENNGWSPWLCDYFGVERDWLPAIRCGSETLGSLRPAVAAEWGLPPGIPVKLGTADTSSAMLAVRLAPGELLHVVGTTQVLGVIAPQPQPDPRRLTRRLGVGPDYVYVAHNPVGGVALTWLRELCYREQTSSEFFEQTVPAVIDRPTWVRLDPPFLGGDRLNIEAHRASLCELTLDTTRDDLLAAVLQAMRRGHADAVEALGNARPRAGARIVLTGGGLSLVRRLIGEYATATIVELEEGSLRGCARLFDPSR